VPVNIAGLDDNVVADTLFGHRKGAFTGAEGPRVGLVHGASGGTLFLDEIADSSSACQVKLLRLVQEREYFPLGSDVPNRGDARIIVATNQDVSSSLASGRLRRDLYHRLSTHHIHLPPLRERGDDLPLLVDHFLDEASAELGKRKPSYPKELLALLASHPFPGNVRELRSMVFDAVSNHKARMLSLARFEAAMGVASGTPGSSPAPAPIPVGAGIRFPQQLPTLRAAEQALLAEALRRAQGSQSIAARMLGITRQALNRRLRRRRDVPPDSGRRND